jgi:hypothetical protein
MPKVNRSARKAYAPKDLETYQMERSTKLDMLIRILQYHLAKPNREYYNPDKDPEAKDLALPLNIEEDVRHNNGYIPDEQTCHEMPPEKILIYYAWPFTKSCIVPHFPFKTQTDA